MKDKIPHLKVYTVTYFFIYAAIAALFPFFPLLLQNKGLNPSQVGFLMGSYDLFSIAGLMIIGHFYDKIRSPRNTIVAIGLVSISILFLLSNSSKFISLIILTLFLGFFIKSPTSLLDALYGQTMKNSQESYGKIRLSGSLGFLSTALLIHMTGWIQGSKPLSIFTGYAICLIIALLASIFLPSEFINSPQKQLRTKSLLTTIKSFPKIFWIGLTIAFLSSLSMSGHYTFFSLLLKNKFNMENVSGFWAIGPLFEIPLFYFSSVLIRKFKLRTLWTICLLAGTARMQVYSLSTSLLPLYLIQTVHSLSFALNHISMISLITKYTSTESRGFAMSLYMAIGMGLSMFVGGVLGGSILKISGFPLLFQVFSLFPLLAIGISFLFLKEEKPGI